MERRPVQQKAPDILPDALLTAPPTAKCLYLSLRGKGTVSFSTRDLARSLGLTQPSIRVAFEIMRDAGALVFEQEPRERVKPVFRVLTREEVEQRERDKSHPVL